MKFLKLGLLTMLISLFILGGCKNPDTVGLEVDPSDQIQGTLVDTISVYSKTLPEDSIITTNLKKTPLALMQDETFGVTEAHIATSLGLPGGIAFSRPAGDLVIDSAILVLKYTSGFYGDSLNTAYRVNVHQLEERPYFQNYYNTKVWKYGSDVIGGKSFHAKPTDSLYIRQIVEDGPDTLAKVSSQLRIPIDPNFITQKIFYTSSSNLVSDEAFNNYIKGLYITLDKEQTTGKGGVMYFNPDSCGLAVYYRATSNGATDTTIAAFTVNTVTVSNIKHIYTGTPIETVLSSTNPNETVGYVQGLLGLRAKISFPFLKQFKENAGDIVLNRAELVITPIQPIDNIFQPASRLTLYRYDIAGQRTNLPDANSGDPRFIGLGSFGGFYDGTKKAYRFVITGYIQDLMRGRLIDYGTFFSPTDLSNTSSVDFSPSILNAGRTVFGGGANAAGYRMKLNVIYSKLQ